MKGGPGSSSPWAADISRGELHVSGSEVQHRVSLLCDLGSFCLSKPCFFLRSLGPLNTEVGDKLFKPSSWHDIFGLVPVSHFTMVYCSALNCQNATSGVYKNSTVTFYGFPLQNQPLLKQWIHNMGRDMGTPSKHQRLCSKHFEDSSFEIDPLKIRKNRRLLKEAVPKKFILGEDGNWLVGTPQSFCGGISNKTRKRIRNPEHLRVIKIYAIVFTSLKLKEDLHVKHFKAAAVGETRYAAVKPLPATQRFSFFSLVLRRLEVALGGRRWHWEVGDGGSSRRLGALCARLPILRLNVGGGGKICYLLETQSQFMR